MRFFLAFLLIGISLTLAGRFSIPSRRDLLGLVALGGIGYFLQSTFYFTALLYIPVSVVALFLNTYPAFVTAGSLALGWEKASIKVISSLSLALTGLVLVANPIKNAAGFGMLIALGASVTYTVYILVSTRVLKALSGELGSFYITGAASLSFGMSSLLTGQLRLGWNLDAWIWVSIISLISTSLAITAFFQGLKIVGPTRSSILSTAELVTSVIAAAVIFNEYLSITQLIGGILILSASILAALS